MPVGPGELCATVKWILVHSLFLVGGLWVVVVVVVVGGGLPSKQTLEVVVAGGCFIHSENCTVCHDPQLETSDRFQMK